MEEMDLPALQLQLERSRAARLRAWTVLVELRAILTGAGQELAKPAEKSFEKEGEILERALRKALKDRDEGVAGVGHGGALGDRSAFGKEEGFAQAHQALLKALEKAGDFYCRWKRGTAPLLRSPPRSPDVRAEQFASCPACLNAVS
jgi:hypothetical protein